MRLKLSANAGAYSYPGLDKAAFMEELQRHADADQIVKGAYWENGKGCAVGYSLHSVAVRLDLPVEGFDFGNHGHYETYLGIPHILARLEDRIFEGLAVSFAKLWPMKFSGAIAEGADLSGIWDKFAPWLLREIALPAVPPEYARVRNAIIAITNGFETGWNGVSRETLRKEAQAVAYADTAYAGTAAAVAYAVAYAAAAAAAVADVAYAHAAVAVAYATVAVAYDAYDAADARHAAYRKMAEKLCELMAAAPMVAS